MNTINYLNRTYTLIDYTVDDINRKEVEKYATDNMTKVRIELIALNEGYLIQFVLYDDDRTVNTSTVKRIAKFNAIPEDSVFIAMDFLLKYCVSRLDSCLHCVWFDPRYVVFHLEPTALAI